VAGVEKRDTGEKRERGNKPFSTIQFRIISCWVEIKKCSGKFRRREFKSSVHSAKLELQVRVAYAIWGAVGCGLGLIKGSGEMAQRAG